MSRAARTLQERLSSYVRAEDGPLESPCHIWHGATNHADYPVMSVRWVEIGKEHRHARGGWTVIQAHRAAWIAAGRALTSGMHLHHECRQPRCVNPDHLAELDPSTHGTLAIHPLVTHCYRGHEYDEANTRWENGRRRCRKCVAINGRAKYWRNKRKEAA